MTAGSKWRICCAAAMLAAVTLVQHAQAPKATAKTAATQKTKAKKKETAGEWFQRVLGIDMRAYLNLTAYRRLTGIDAAPRLALFDRTTGEEKTLWACGACWSPARVDNGTVILRQTDETPEVELWLVADGGAAPKRVAVVPGAAGITGTLGGRVFVAATRERCNSSVEGLYGLIEVNATTSTVAELPDAPCIGSASFGAMGRVRGDRLLSTTRKIDQAGNRRNRRILVLAPATGQAPTGNYFDARLKAPPDRFDPIWVTDDRIVYVARP
jgi:hypothetical protein